MVSKSLNTISYSPYFQSLKIECSTKGEYNVIDLDFSKAVHEVLHAQLFGKWVTME